MLLSPARRLHGLVAATDTPFHSDGSLNLTIVERQASHLLRNGVSIAFIGGTTGESSSLTFANYGYMSAAKAVMGMLGVDAGPARLPNSQLTPEQIAHLRRDLKTMGFFDWIEL